MLRLMMTASCWLTVWSAWGRWVDVVARTALQPGDELLLDYGSRPLRDFLQGYGFTPCNCANEVSSSSFINAIKVQASRVFRVSSRTDVKRSVLCLQIFDDLGGSWELLHVKGLPQVGQATLFSGVHHTSTWQRQ